MSAIMRKKKKKILPSISVIIFTRETPFMLLKRCISCVRNQTLEDIEIILLDANDEGSPYQQAISSESDFFQGIIKIEYPEKGELVHGKNLALEKATADYITFISAQDIMPETRLETVIRHFKNHHRHCVYYTGMTIQDNNTLESSNYTLASGKYNYLAQAVFHRSAFELIGNFDEELIALCDEDLWMRIEFYSLANYILEEGTEISICKEIYENHTALNAAIAYQQILMKYPKIFRQKKSLQKKIYFKIAQNYKKEHIILRYLQFQWKGMFCR